MKVIIGNGVVVAPETLLGDLESLKNNGIKYEKRVFISNRCHIETELHKAIAYKVREIREDTVWINGSDIAMTFKPLKMGLRMAHLVEDDWKTFKTKYERIIKSAEKLYRIDLDKSDIE